jgi:hypothetical protein
MVPLSLVKNKLLPLVTITLFVFAAVLVSGFTVIGLERNANSVGGAAIPAAQAPVNVIVNGDFEKPWENREGVAPDWLPYSNGQAHFGWYEEIWPEAVYRGNQAQLMEIFEVEPNVQSRVIAIHQTVDVAPDSTYNLEFFAMMRSQVQVGDRNKNEFELHWGVDFSGQGDYENVQTWHHIPLEEQYRLGSTGKYPEDIPLFYEVVTDTVETGQSRQVTLFIRGLKKFATGAEVNFDIDDVSLIGPPPSAQPPATPQLPVPAAEDAMPQTGATIANNLPAGAIVLGGLVLVVIGVSATVTLLKKP